MNPDSERATERVAYWLDGAADEQLIELEARELRALLAEHATEVKTLRADNAALLDGNQRLQTMNDGLRRLAIEAREAAEGWHRATIDLYSGREEQHPADCPCGRPDKQAQAERDGDVRAVATVIDALDFVLENGYSADVVEGARETLRERFELDARANGGTS